MTDLHTAARSHRFKDLTGQVFGRLKVVSYAGKNKHGQSLWNCSCDCGTLKTYSNNALGRTVSCGCYYREVACKTNYKHGFGRTKTAAIWRAMIDRCTNSKNPAYPHYGARGIVVCEEWMDFLTFHEEMGDCPDGYSIERLDVNGPYCKQNCKWIPKKLQARNTRKALTFEGKPLAQISEETGVCYATLYTRFKKYGTPFKENANV